MSSGNEAVPLEVWILVCGAQDEKFVCQQCKSLSLKKHVKITGKVL